MISKSSIILVIIFLSSSLLAAQDNKNEKNINRTAYTLIDKTPDGMVLIPGGRFKMGTDDDDLKELVKMGHKVPHMSIGHAEGWYGDERPLHYVDVKPFYMDKYEVTNAQYKVFIKESGYQPEGNWKKHAKKGRENHPVVHVTWKDAKTYAEWAGKRLPAEAEWEYAAKGGRDVKWFSWGDDPDPQKANYRFQGESFFDGLGRLLFGRKINTKTVGSYEPNGYGLFDMVGNVAEWCNDTYGPYPGLKEEDWKHTKHRPFLDDRKMEKRKIFRGGNWDSSNPVFIRINNRTGMKSGYHKYNLGFRCVKSVE